MELGNYYYVIRIMGLLCKIMTSHVSNDLFLVTVHECRYNGIKHLRILKRHNMYGFNVKNCVYSSLLELVVYYAHHSLDTHNPALTTTLAYPYNA